MEQIALLSDPDDDRITVQVDTQLLLGVQAPSGCGMVSVLGEVAPSKTVQQDLVLRARTFCTPFDDANIELYQAAVQRRRAYLTGETWGLT